jgi:nucleoid DNA-binding protein
MNTKSQLLEDLAEKMGVTKKEADGFLGALRTVIVEQLNGPGVIALPGLLKLTLKNKPATPERPGKNPFTGEDIVVKAKPASKQIKAVALKALKDDVN